MRVMVFEHVVGGGMADEAVPPALAAQGNAMWQCAVEDIAAMGYQVVTSVDDRLGLPMPPGWVDRVASRAATDAWFDQAADACDAAMIIAPECGGALLDWTTRLASFNTQLLGCSADAIALCSDKLALASHWANQRINTPPTHAWPCGESVMTGRDKWVMKPQFGAGCEATHVMEPSDFDESDAQQHEEMIVQPFVPGVAVSVLAVVDGDRVVTLLPGAQAIDGEKTLTYHGGALPLAEPYATRACVLAERALRAVTGLRGFVGVDMILAEQADADGQWLDTAIEIDPRLTMSYVGLRALCENNLAELLFDINAPIHWRADGVLFDEVGHVETGAG